MANKPKDQKPTDESVAAADRIYKMARERADAEISKLKQELATKTKQHEAVGALKKIQCDRNYNDLLEAMILYRVKTSKAYKEAGLIWEDFCEVVGINYKTADRILEDVRPIFDKFSDNLSSFLGMELRKIRYLGQKFSDNLSSFEFKDGTFHYQGEVIPATQEDLTAFVESLQDADRKKESSLTKQIEDKTANLRAKDRVLKDKEESLQKAHRRLDKLTRLAEEQKLAPEQAAFLSRMETLRLTFDGSYMVHLDTDAVKPDLLDEDGKPVAARMRAAYLATLWYFKMQIDYAYGQAEERYGDSDLLPETAWKQPTLEDLRNLKKGRSPSAPFPSGAQAKSIKN